MSENKKTPYSIMKSAVDKSFEPSIEEMKSVNSFFLTRYISNDPSTIYIANILNCNARNIPVDAQYKFIRNSTMEKVAFINYPKKDKLITDKDLKLIIEYYKCSEIVAKEYVKILGPEKTQEILDKYKNISKQLKDL